MGGYGRSATGRLEDNSGKTCRGGGEQKVRSGEQRNPIVPSGGNRNAAGEYFIRSWPGGRFAGVGRWIVNKDPCDHLSFAIAAEGGGPGQGGIQRALEIALDPAKMK
jgi:hypothetical protein